MTSGIEIDLTVITSDSDAARYVRVRLPYVHVALHALLPREERPLCGVNVTKFVVRSKQRQDITCRRCLKQLARIDAGRVQRVFRPVRRVAAELQAEEGELHAPAARHSTRGELVALLVECLEEEYGPDIFDAINERLAERNEIATI